MHLIVDFLTVLLSVLASLILVTRMHTQATD